MSVVGMILVAMGLAVAGFNGWVMCLRRSGAKRMSMVGVAGTVLLVFGARWGLDWMGESLARGVVWAAGMEPGSLFWVVGWWLWGRWVVDAEGRMKLSVGAVAGVAGMMVMGLGISEVVVRGFVLRS